MNYIDEIKQEVECREISLLYHFTPFENVRSILINGLASREILEKHEISYVATDEMRLDGRLNGLSLSIHSINWSMFRAKKLQYLCEWAILELDSSILWTHECRFCWANAASREILKHRGFRGGPWALRKMFEDRIGIGGSVREKYSLLDHMPTDEGAEVQVLNIISPELIKTVIVGSEKSKSEAENIVRDSGMAISVCVENL
ncbi:DarT ssDNA thymidine ADP-ribosyltransferase family protein [Sandaracinobacteroides hominis]|uniref:DarT ssDNA thymidine ADP-ribosyltransferase family protein n=1 Tax=Sandaracinobacteroides hominis TaxID=2780086 RepID=UPI0018F2B2FB|nr:DarT ssDNA thymidine ADP-ribosyltransferase family protein [Sandaracinobacteroides hominis]